MKKIRKNAFTLVELLAVIVILAIILVIAVPNVINVINDVKKGTLESTAKMIASQAEKQKVQNTILGKDDAITCKSVAKINDIDYAACSILFNNLDEAGVTIVGKGKFAGLYVCNGTKTSAIATEEKCVSNAVSFEDDDWATIVAAVQLGNYPYKVNDEKVVDLGSLGLHTLRISNITPCDGLSLASQTACGFVLEFKDIITSMVMKPSGEYGDFTFSGGHNVGGWPKTDVYDYVNETVYNAIPIDLRNGIIDTYVVSSHGSGDTGKRTDGNFESVDKLYLLSPEEVYGDLFVGTFDSSNGTSRQLDYYANNKFTSSDKSGAIKYEGSTSKEWWLRSADSRSFNLFYGVISDGKYNTNSADTSVGVSPAFRIG